MKVFNGIEQLAETIRQISERAKNNEQNLNDLKGVLISSKNEVLNRLKSEKEKKEYSDLIKVSNELLEKAPSRSMEEIHKSIENLRKYGKQYSNNS